MMFLNSLLLSRSACIDKYVMYVMLPASFELKLQSYKVPMRPQRTNSGGSKNSIFIWSVCGSAGSSSVWVLFISVLL